MDKKTYITPDIEINVTNIEASIMESSGVTTVIHAKQFDDSAFDYTFEAESEEKAEWTEGIEIFPKVL